ncbi:hypothetical protein [Methylocella silvestris]|uniref:hypothetical protein n=1 Tax=Methylocella silvestris TaxID=199596 RepID=UPI0011AF04EC|nr:hypothetical protein [Methylocella silvestris]
MAEIPSAEESARKILRVLVDDGSLSGQGGPIPQVQHRFAAAVGAYADFDKAKDYALKKKWLILGQNNFLLLTDSGFKEA